MRKEGIRVMRNPWVPGLLLAATLLVAATVFTTTSYPDVPSGKWWTSYPALARGLGIARGFPAGESRCPTIGAERMFCPDAPATRAEVAAMVVRGVAALAVLLGLLGWLLAALRARRRPAPFTTGTAAPAPTPAIVAGNMEFSLVRGVYIPTHALWKAAQQGRLL